MTPTAPPPPPSAVESTSPAPGSASAPFNMALASMVFFVGGAFCLLLIALSDVPRSVQLYTAGATAEAEVLHSDPISADSPSRRIGFRFTDHLGTSHDGEFVVPWYGRKRIGERFRIAYLPEQPTVNAAAGATLLVGPVVAGLFVLLFLIVAAWSVRRLTRRRAA